MVKTHNRSNNNRNKKDDNLEKQNMKWHHWLKAELNKWVLNAALKVANNEECLM